MSATGWITLLFLLSCCIFVAFMVAVTYHLATSVKSDINHLNDALQASGPEKSKEYL